MATRKGPDLPVGVQGPFGPALVVDDQQPPYSQNGKQWVGPSLLRKTIGGYACGSSQFQGRKRFFRVLTLGRWWKCDCLHALSSELTCEFLFLTDGRQTRN